MSSSLGTLPAEIHRIILRLLTNNDLVSLSRTSRNCNLLVVSSLYQHTILDFALSDDDSSAVVDNDTALSALLGLVADTQRQCQYIERLTFRRRGQEYDISMAQGEGLANDDDDDDETISALSCLLEPALRNMSNLSHLDWLAIMSTPKAVFSAVQAPLKTLYCSAAWLEKGPDFDFSDTAILRLLASFSVTDIPEGAVPLLLRLILLQDETPLKSFKLQYLQPADDNHLATECILESLVKALTSDGKLVNLNLTTLSLSLPRAPTSTSWLKHFVSASLTDLTYHIQPHGDEREDAAVETMHNKLFANFHAHTETPPSALKTLQTNTFPASLTTLIESSRNLEQLILTYQPPSFCGDAINLSGHFSSLRALCLPHADRIFYDDKVRRLYGRELFGYLQVIIDKCPLLEELAMNLCAGQEESFFKNLHAAPALKRLFILLYRDSPWDLQLPAGALLRKMLYQYWGDNASPFFERLQLFSCFRSLWVFEHSLDLTDEEREEMEYELDYESVSDDELADLGIAVERRRDLGISLPCRKREGECKGQGEDENEDDDDMGFDLFDDMEPNPRPSQPKNDYKYPQNYPPPPVPILYAPDGRIILPRHLLDEPYCYTWERAISGYYKVPFRVSWDDPQFLDDRMVNAVRGIVEQYQWTDPENKRGVEDEWRGATT